MKKSKKGFTLIELLVVVLIIGILAAIAVPQYQIAVEKSRAAQVLSAIATIEQAQEAYYLANNQYANSLDKLDVSINVPQGWNVTDEAGVIQYKIEFTSTNYPGELSILRYYKNNNSAIAPGRTYCWANTNNAKALKICKSLSSSQLDANRWIL